MGAWITRWGIPLLGRLFHLVGYRYGESLPTGTEPSLPNWLQDWTPLRTRLLWVAYSLDGKTLQDPTVCSRPKFLSQKHVRSKWGDGERPRVLLLYIKSSFHKEIKRSSWEKHSPFTPTTASPPPIKHLDHLEGPVLANGWEWISPCISCGICVSGYLARNNS